MRCAACNRRLKDATVEIGGNPYGPVCARRMRLARGVYREKPAERARVGKIGRRAQAQDERQGELWS